MTWIKISEQMPDLEVIHFLTDGKTVFMKGSTMQPFYVQLCGAYTSIDEFTPTHWTTLPKYWEINND